MNAHKIAPKVACRKPVSKRVRFEVLKRDGFRCVYCGAGSSGVQLEVDHIVPVARGGSNEASNLVTACFDCNRGKSDKPLSEAQPSLDRQADAIASSETSVARFKAAAAERDQRIERDVWEVVDRLYGEKSVTPRRFDSIKGFLERLDAHEVFEAADIARRRCVGRPSIFSYFCGVCWRKIERQ